MLKELNKTEELGLAGLATVLLLGTWIWVLIYTPTEINMGDVYRIIYVHVPVASVGLFLSGFILFTSSLLGVIKPHVKTYSAGLAAVEMGLIFTILTLVTGSIWGKPTWNTYWTWDPRLTTTLLLAILYFSYLVCDQTLADNTQKKRILGALGILFTADIPVIYFSVKLWRSLHQPSSLLEQRGSTLDPAMLKALLWSLGATWLFALVLWRLRYFTHLAREKLKDHDYREMMAFGQNPGRDIHD